MSTVSSGPLVLADLSGYTSYLGGVELEHSHDVLADLLETVVGALRGALAIDKLEGDAVFCVGSGGGLELAVLEDCYAAFARRRFSIAQATTCPCAACRRIVDLDLKFVAHHGEYVATELAGRRELVGSDVIVAHRLLKNDVAGSGYLLLTDAAARAWNLDPAALGMRRHEEGRVRCWLRDLDAWWRDEAARGTVVVAAADADVAAEGDVPAAPEVTWEWVTSPARRPLWQDMRSVTEEGRGARGAGTVAHCAHGRQVWREEIVDWKPFDHATYVLHNPFGDFMHMTRLTPLDGGTGTHVALLLQGMGGRRGQRLGLLALGRRLRADQDAALARLAKVVRDGP